MPKHGSINLYVHGNQKARLDGQPRTSTSTFTQLLNYEASDGGRPAFHSAEDGLSLANIVLVVTSAVSFTVSEADVTR